MSLRKVRRSFPAVLLAASAIFMSVNAQAETFQPVKLSFGPGTPMDGFTALPDAAKYDAATGYGFEPGAAVFFVTGKDGHSVAKADGSFLFSAKVPEGNYRVTAWLGGTSGESDTAVKAESRRVMVPLTHTTGGQTTKVTFVVNVHVPKISDTESVKLNDREHSPDVRHWDDKLTLEFAGAHPAVAAVQIEKVDDAVTVFLAGDSTVTDQPGEPWAAWGQLLPQFFDDKVAIANYAESGRTLKSFKGDKRWDKILSQIKPNDYVFIQFGHNDMKETGNGIGPYTSFSESLRKYIADARAKQAKVVVLTPMHRRHFAGNEITPTFGDYPDAIRKVANETQTPLIDLQLMSKPLYEAFGPEKSKQLFVYFPAHTYPGQEKDLKDDTHFQAFGADQIARCVVQGIRDLKLPLADDLRPGIAAFDPAHPGDPSKYDLPASTPSAAKLPEGK